MHNLSPLLHSVRHDHGRSVDRDLFLLPTLSIAHVFVGPVFEPSLTLCGTGVLLCGTGVLLCGTGVVLCGMGVLLCGMGVLLCGMGVLLCGTGVVLCGMGVIC